MGLHLTAKAINALDVRDRPYRVHDDRPRELAILVRPSGRKRWIVRRSIKRRRLEIVIGEWPTMTIPAARDAAAALLSDLSRGLMPGARCPTLAQAWDVYQRRHLPTLAPRTADDYRARWWPRLGPLAGRPLDLITRAEVSYLIALLAEQSPVDANRTRALLSSIYGRALEWGMYSGLSPTIGVKPQPETPRKRYLDRGEVAKLLAALDGERPVIRDYIRVLLMTGARRGEVMAMKWGEIRDGLWTHPAKRGSVTVPLAPQVQATLEGRPRINGFVFPGRGGRGHLSRATVTRAWLQVRRAAGLPDVRLHDLRHTLASWQAMAGASLQVIGASLGHARTSTTERYAHLQLETVRASVDQAVSAMMGAGDDQTDQAAAGGGLHLVNGRDPAAGSGSINEGGR